MTQKTLTLIVTGSIAAVKAFALIEELRKRGICVSVILTRAAQQWVTKAAAEPVTDRPVLTTEEAEAQLETTAALLKDSDVILAAPASADFLKQLAWRDAPLARMVRGSGAPLLIAPAMNVMMWQHPAVRRNTHQLLAENISFLGPVQGSMACGDSGYGRFMEPPMLAEATERFLHRKSHAAFSAVHESLQEPAALPALGTQKKRILLMIQGGTEAPALYALISALRARGYEITCALNEQAAALLPAEGLASLSGHPVYSRHYQADPQGMEHIRLPENADLLLVFPATSQGLHEMAQGGGDNFLDCLYLATKKPVLVIPAREATGHASAADRAMMQEDGALFLDTPEEPHDSLARAAFIATQIDNL